jgi:DNA polymerase III delta prime subunit
MNNISIPWVEKYRPDVFDNIVLESINKTILNNIIVTNHFPNLLLYGPPGTGKTTTIINVIHKYQKQYNQEHKGLIIHLNASDERGIDVIRNQIRQFVESDTLFSNGTKFVILDEVDYMTKHAQQSLKYLLQYSNNNVRYCLICNYISRIDESLQSEFMRLRFNQLPEKDIFSFLKKICTKERLKIDDEKITYIQKLYKSDMRSMINYLQCNKSTIKDIKVLNVDVWMTLIKLLRIKENHKNILVYFEYISETYNMDIKDVIKEFLKYVITEESSIITLKLTEFIEYIMHLRESNIIYYKNFAALSLNKLFLPQV